MASRWTALVALTDSGRRWRRGMCPWVASHCPLCNGAGGRGLAVVPTPAGLSRPAFDQDLAPLAGVRGGQETRD